MNCRRSVHSWSTTRELKAQDVQSEDNYDSRSAASSGDVSGLKIRSGINSRQKLVFSDREICDDVLATLPKLDAAVRNNAKGDRWKHSGKGGVYLAEMKPYCSLIDPDYDADILHAVAAKTELRCHLNEALSVLLHQDSEGYDSTMKSLCGKRFKSGEMLFHQRAPIEVVKEGGKTSNQGAISVTSATICPSTSLKVRLQSRHSRTQQLVFSTYTRHHADKKRAIHLMKTVPKDVHDQVLPSSENSLLHRELDHIGVGFDLQFTPRLGGSNRQSTQIFVHSYASDKPSRFFSKDVPKEPEMVANDSSAELARRRVTVVNPETRQVMQMLTESLSQFERVIRRRRFGFQAFIYFPMEYADPLLEKRCLICNKTFHFFRRDFYCQLCGHMVCRDCSELYEVEVRIGEIRKNRCCRMCVVRVDACKFDDEDLLPALGPIIVETPSDAWLPSEGSILSSSSSGNEQNSPLESEGDDLMGQFCSEDPEVRSRALEILGRLVGSRSSSDSSSSITSSSKTIQLSSRRGAKAQQKSKKTRRKTQVQHVMANIEKHLNEELSKARLKCSVESCDVSDRTRDYKYEFDATKVAHEDLPLAPKPEAQKDVRRVELIKSSGALQSGYDRSALDLIAQVAAKRLGCPIGVVSMIDDQQFHAVGNFNLPSEAHHLPRDEVPCMHSVYAEKPLVIKNPQRDMRFSKMPCVDDFGVKFYAGFPLRAPGGEVIGNLCTLDAVAHNNISTKDYSTMETLAKLASDLLSPNTGAFN